jgi:hypothetical protein
MSDRVSHISRILDALPGWFGDRVDASRVRVLGPPADRHRTDRRRRQRLLEDVPNCVKPRPGGQDPRCWPLCATAGQGGHGYGHRRCSHHETNKRAKCPPFRRTVCARGPAADGLGSAPLRAHRSGGSGSALRVVGGGCAQVRSARGGPGGHGRGCWFRCGSELRLVGHRAAGGRGSAPRAVGGDLRPGVSSPTLGGPGGLAVSRSGCPGAARWRFGSPSGWARAVRWSLLAVDMVSSTACRMSWVAASGCDTNEG